MPEELRNGLSSPRHASGGKALFRLEGDHYAFLRTLCCCMLLYRSAKTEVERDLDERVCRLCPPNWHDMLSETSQSHVKRLLMLEVSAKTQDRLHRLCRFVGPAPASTATFPSPRSHAVAQAKRIQGRGSTMRLVGQVASNTMQARCRY